jgi:hypothetical protein
VFAAHGDLSREDPHVLLMSDEEEVQSDWEQGDELGEKDNSLEGQDVARCWRSCDDC